MGRRRAAGRAARRGVRDERAGTHPKDLWCFAKRRCLVAKNFRDAPGAGSRMAVALWFEDGSNAVLEASEANCMALETLLKEVLLPTLPV